MPFDSRGRIKGTKKCEDFHTWAAFDWTIEGDSLFTIERCSNCGVERKQYRRTATSKEQEKFKALEEGKGFWVQQ